MAKINSYNFGFIVIDGKQYTSDVVISPDGTVKEREPSKGRVGSHHIGCSEIESINMGQPDAIVVGTGASGLATLSSEAEVYLHQVNSNLIILPTPQAIQKFNKLAEEGKRVAALIHVTC